MDDLTRHPLYAKQPRYVPSTNSVGKCQFCGKEGWHRRELDGNLSCLDEQGCFERLKARLKVLEENDGEGRAI